MTKTAGATRNSWTATGSPLTRPLWSWPLRDLGHPAAFAPRARVARVVLVQEEPPGPPGELPAQRARELDGDGERALDLPGQVQRAARRAQLQVEADQPAARLPRGEGHAADALHVAVPPHEPAFDHAAAHAHRQRVHGEVVAEARGEQPPPFGGVPVAPAPGV